MNAGPHRSINTGLRAARRSVLCLSVGAVFAGAAACTWAAAPRQNAAPAAPVLSPCPTQPGNPQSSAESDICPPGQPESGTLPAGATLLPTGAPLPGPELPPSTPSPSPLLPSPASPQPGYDPATATTPAIPPTPCPPEYCAYQGALFLARPIAPPGRDAVDASYRFETTQEGLRDPHHGVEFLNSQGTPVLAAAGGMVVVAGDDRQTFYGPYSYFYGNLVVLRHDLPPALRAFGAGPLYTLYGHLSKVEVETGQTVQAGQEIGQVGMTGVATGSHLHFEVRLGENAYAASRNPELWLQPHPDERGQLKGALAGRILDGQGNYLKVENIVLEHLPAPGQPGDREFYVGTYAEKKLSGLPPWDENFAIGDIPAGWYRISFAQFGFQQREVQVLPGQLTVVTFDLGK